MAAAAGSAARRTDASSPTSNSRLISRPTTKKKITINPSFTQFFKDTAVTAPANTFVYLDEHPDTLNDGFFMNRLEETPKWGNLPASHHNGAGNLVFADGHTETHRWAVTSGPSSTLRPNVKGGAGGIFVVDVLTDWDWLKERTSVVHR